MTDITLKYLIVNNFKKLTEFELNFVTNSLCLIKGSNGSGKSSIFESIYTCLYGSITGTTDADVIQRGKQSAKIELGLEINKELYKIERTLGKGAKLVVTKGDLVISDKSSLSKNIVENLIPEFIIKLSMLQARSKNEIKTLIKDVVTSILNVDEFFEKLKNKITELNSNINDKKNEHTKFEINRNNISNYVNEMKNKIDYTKNEISVCQEKIKTIDIELNGVVIDDLIRLMAVVTQEYNNRINNINKKLSDEYQSINNVIQECKLKLNHLDTQKNNILNEAKIEGQKIDNNALNVVTNLEKQAYAIDIEIRNRTNEIAHKTTELSVDKCPVCKQTISLDIKNEVKLIIEKLKSELEEYKRNKEIILNKMTEQRNNSSEQKKEAMKIFSEQLNAVKIEYDNIVNTELTELNNQAEVARYNINNVDKVTIYDSILKEYNVDKTTLENSQKYITLNTEKNSLLSKIDVLTNEISYNTNKISEFDINIQKFVDSINSNQLEIDTLYNKLSEYEYWNDSRLLKNILLKKVSSSINSLLSEKYQTVMNINFELGEKDIDIKVTNLNGEEVYIENLSQGEFAITILSIICTFKELISVKYNFNWLILDEFLDRLDAENMSNVVQFLSEKIEGSKFVITHNTYALDLQYWDNVIDMSN